MKKIRIVLCDDHAVVRAGLAAILGYEDDMKVIGQATDGEEAVAMTRSLKPDVVMMDMVMPRCSGVDATAAVLRASPQTRVLVLTSYITPDEVRRTLDAGASGALLKTVSNDVLVDSIRAVVRGERVISPEFQCEESPAGEFEQGLTSKQLAVLQSLTCGMTNKEIACQLGISVNGVKRHLESVFAKLGATTRLEAVAIALRNQLLKL